MNDYSRFLSRCSLALNDICLANDKFTVNDLYLEAVKYDISATMDLRSLATVIIHGVRSGWCVDTGYKVKSLYGHGVPISIYKSLICNGSVLPNKLF